MMRIALVTEHVPLRRELASGPLDAEWIIDNRSRIDPVVFADYQGDGTDVLEEAGVPVHISPKRTVLFADGTYQTAEELQARLLLELHVDEPFHAVIYDSSRPVDWAWHQPQLGDIPRGVALGAGAVRDLRLVTADPGLFATHGRRLWAATGSIASADFLVGEVTPSTHGLDDSRLPPIYRLGEVSVSAAADHPVDLAVVVALSEDPAGFAALVPRAAAAVPAGDDTVFAVVHPDIPSQLESTRDMILSGLTPDLRSRVRLAEPSSDGVADGWLAQADVVVAARASDMAVRAVADAAAKIGGVTLLEAEPDPPPLTAEALQKRHHHPPRLVPMEGSREDIITHVNAIQSEAPAVILYAPEAADLAQRLWRVPGLSAAGLVLVCDAGPYLGEADPTRPAFNVLGLRTTAWPSVRRLMTHAPTLHQLIGAAAALTHAGRTDLLCLPARDVSHGSLTARHSPLPAWVTDDGMLPRPDLAGLAEADPAAAAVRPARDGESVRRWAETHGIGDRLRLALPWKWGLLNRAMKNRW
jgi:hypothetical protein